MPALIPLTIGFANLVGDAVDAIAAEDATALAPLFERARGGAAHEVPSAEVLFVYADLEDDGTIKGTNRSGLRQIVQVTNAAIVVLASPNDAASIQNAVKLPGPKTANLVFTLSRNGSGFSRFFRELFEKMRDGKEMLAAWAELAPQHPSAQPDYAPGTIFLAEGGKLGFPR
jgi:hypothetical protein